MGSANVTNVAVSCSANPTFTVGGTVSGLSGTVVLQDNGADNLTVTANGPFTFATGLASGAAYAVTVKTNPAGQTCTVANGSGTMGSANVTNVAVSCSANPTFTVGGTVSGLSGTVVLQDNGGRQPDGHRQRSLHVRDGARAGRRLRRHGEDQPGRADLHGRQRQRDDGLGERDQRGRVVFG